VLPETAARHQRLTPPHTQAHHLLRRTLEHAQDAVVIGLMALLLVIATSAIWMLFTMIVAREVPSQVVLSQVVFVLILTELYRTLIFYLREHRVAVGLIVETTIVSILRELILTFQHAEWPLILSISALLLVLGGLLTLDRWLTRSWDDVSDTSAH
jgi:uncharacterized membrane protein (DUF373 family)